MLELLKRPPAEILEKDLCLVVPHVTPSAHSVSGLNTERTFWGSRLTVELALVPVGTGV